MSLVWCNGTLVDKLEARVSPVDHGFLYGDGVWEPLRAVDGRLRHVDEHLQCLFRSAEILGLALPLSPMELRQAIETTLAANQRREGYIRVIATRGPGTLGPDPRKLDPQILIIAEEYHPFPRELHAHGLHASTYPARLDRSSPLFHARVLGQPHLVLARQHALKHGCLEAILTDRDGRLIGATEGSLFLVTRGDILAVADSPPEVVGECMAKLASQAGRIVRSEAITVDDLLAADEAFIAGTAAGVIAVVKVDGKTIGVGSAGPVARGLREAYSTE